VPRRSEDGVGLIYYDGLQRLPQLVLQLATVAQQHG